SSSSLFVSRHHLDLHSFPTRRSSDLYFRGVFDFGSPVVLSFMLVWVVALFHFGNLRLGSAFQNLWTVVKLLLISVLIGAGFLVEDRKSTRLNSSHVSISYAVFCLKKK